jgi:hypothetical protein
MSVAVTRKLPSDLPAKQIERPDLSLLTPTVTTGQGKASFAKEQPDQYDESFARMMVNLSATTQQTSAESSDDSSTDTSPMSSASVINDVSESTLSKNASSETDTLQASADQSAKRSAKDDFMDYMNQTDAEKLRQELTGVTKAQYDQMSPEEKLAVDQKVQQLLKKKQEIAEVTLKAKIAVAKSMDTSQVL